MATAMVALTFGLARLMLDKEISRAVVFVAVLAADLGLLVLVAQKKSDLYRIFRISAVVLSCIFGIPILPCIISDSSSCFFALVVLLPITVVLIFLAILFHKLIVKSEAREHESDHKRENETINQP